MKWPTGLRLHLIIALWSMSAVSCIAGAYFSARTVVNQRRQVLYETLDRSTDELIDIAFADLSADREVARLPSVISSSLSFQQLERIVRVFDAEKKLIYSNGTPSENEFFNEIFEKSTPENIQPAEFDGKSYFVTSESYKLLSGETRTVQVAAEMLSLSDVLAGTTPTYLIFLLILMAISFVVASVLANTILRPVGEIATQLSSFVHTSPKEWSLLKTHRDAGYLNKIVAIINQLVSSLQISNLSNHNMTQSLAHEIRTPLTMMLGEIETLSAPEIAPQEWKSAIQRFTRDISRIDTIVRTILELARRGQQTDFIQTEKMSDLPSVTRKVIDDCKRAFSVEIQLEDRVSGHDNVVVDRDLYSILLDNLLRNSAKHSKTGRPYVRIKLEKSLANEVLLTLEDDGTGLPLDLLDALHLNQPHPRLGIGLNLCREVCQATGWTMTFENIKAGGLRIMVSLGALMLQPSTGSLPTSFVPTPYRGARPFA